MQTTLVNLAQEKRYKFQSPDTKSCFEISISYKRMPQAERPQIRGSETCFNYITSIELLQSEVVTREIFIAIFLDRANKIIGHNIVSMGGMTGTVVDAKLIFKAALLSNACAVILCHNHPSGNIVPSQADIDLTRKLVKAGENLALPILDHLIIAQNDNLDYRYYSFADAGMMN